MLHAESTICPQAKTGDRLAYLPVSLSRQDGAKAHVSGAIRLIDPRPLLRQGIRAAILPVAHRSEMIEADHVGQFSQREYRASALVIVSEAALKDEEAALLGMIRQAASGLAVLFETAAFAERMKPCLAGPRIRLIPAATPLTEFARCIASLLGRSEPDEADGGERQNFMTLTAMQYRVLALIAEGLLNKQIAFRCSISEATVKSHASEIFRKLNIQRRSEAAVIFTRLTGHIRAEPRSAALLSSAA